MIWFSTIVAYNYTKKGISGVDREEMEEGNPHDGTAVGICKIAIGPP